MLPNFLIIGAPRSGTTWIERNLREHPDVYMPDKKELHFFDKHYNKGLDFYEAFFAGWNGQKAVGEATPDYLHGSYSERDIPVLIQSHLPHAKLIASLRNPVERAYSRYWNAKAKYEHNANLTFEEKLREKPEFIEEGLYVDQLQRYYARFPRRQILILLLDDLVADPKRFMRRIYEFLDIDPAFESGLEYARINTAAGKKNLAKSQALWLVDRALLRLKLSGLAERLRSWNSLDQPPMDPSTKRMLIDIYRPKNLQLQDMIGRDLCSWNE
ncbi:MAG: sulfotransferase domain-containing protein [Acidobacteria bacterium]|nr:sulfotransferase domain-containing protein [Acidobacteriota bacterium]